MESNNFEISSTWLRCSTSEEIIFDFLSHLKNLEHILPKDKIQNIQFQNNKLSFEIENIIKLTLFINQIKQKKDTTDISFIEYLSEPFGNYYLLLKASFKDNQSQIVLSGYLNPFVLNIAKKKLNYLVNKINEKLSEFSPSNMNE
ncbi:MAG: hypothetical protein N2203_02005 [Bacteroidia bacterium]|nr:hypothetical protein [Bacteroidia bacterium]